MRIRTIWLLPLLALILQASACQEEGVKKLPTIDITLQGKTIKAEVADTHEERAVGLMYRRSLGEYEGMLFVYDHDERLSFYMKNTYLPLSIAFVSADGEILQIEDMKPLDESTIESHFSVRYALEVNQGAFARWGAAVGDRMSFPPAGFPK